MERVLCSELHVVTLWEGGETCGVALMSRLLNMIGLFYDTISFISLFCKRDL